MGMGTSETAIHPRDSQRVKLGTKRPAGNAYPKMSIPMARNPKRSMGTHQAPSLHNASGRGGKKTPPVRKSTRENSRMNQSLDLRQNSTRATANHMLVVAMRRIVMARP